MWFGSVGRISIRPKLTFSNANPTASSLRASNSSMMPSVPSSAAAGLVGSFGSGRLLSSKYGPLPTNMSTLPAPKAYTLMSSSVWAVSLNVKLRLSCFVKERPPEMYTYSPMVSVAFSIATRSKADEWSISTLPVPVWTESLPVGSAVKLIAGLAWGSVPSLPPLSSTRYPLADSKNVSEPPRSRPGS